jgi:hypothetical protein
MDVHRHLGRGVAAAVAACLLALAAAAPVVAQSAAPWHERYRRGVALADRGSWEPALRELEAAARVEPRPRKHIAVPGGEPILGYDPHYHMARCLTELGRYPAAALQLRAAMRAGVTPRPRIEELRARIEAAVREAIAAATPAAAPTAAATPVPAPSAEAPTPPPARPSPRVTAGATPRPAPRATAATAAPPAAPTSPAQPTAGPTVPPTVVPTATAGQVAAEPRPAPTWRAAAVWLAGAGAALGGALWWLLRRRRRREDPALTPTRVIAAASTMVRAGQSLGVWELTGLLGRGGMATTYRAARTGGGAEVALKVPHEGCLADPTFLARFLREGKLGEQLHHPRIVRIFEAAEHDGRPYLAMELLAGRTLKQALRDNGPFPVRRAVEIAADIAEALDYAHVKGVVHRDLKPENVMVLPDGAVKVMDFGIARLAGQEGLTSSQFFLGTPLYAAPEMIEPKSIDHRVDLYSLGIILFEMLQGTVPFNADSPFKVLQMHQREPLPARDRLARPVPETVWRVVERLCAKSPADRYPTAEALLVELHALLRALPETEETGG